MGIDISTNRPPPLKSDAIAVGRLPVPPEGTTIEDVEVVVRVTPAAS